MELLAQGNKSMANAFSDSRGHVTNQHVGYNWTYLASLESILWKFKEFLFMLNLLSFCQYSSIAGEFELALVLKYQEKL